MSDQPTIIFHDSVYTKDGTRLGMAQRIYRNTDHSGLETEPYDTHLEVVDFDAGEDYYIPLEYVAERDASLNQLHIALTYKQVGKMTLSNVPRYIAYRVADATELPRAE